MRRKLTLNRTATAWLVYHKQKHRTLSENENLYRQPKNCDFKSDSVSKCCSSNLRYLRLKHSSFQPSLVFIFDTHSYYLHNHYNSKVQILSVGIFPLTRIICLFNKICFFLTVSRAVNIWIQYRGYMVNKQIPCQKYLANKKLKPHLK